MNPPTPWINFLNRLKRGVPLEFVHGLRYPVMKSKSHCIHDHPTIEIVFHVAGSGQVKLSGERSLYFPERSAVIHAPKEPHDQIMDYDGEDICIHIAAPANANLDAASSLCIESIDDIPAIADLEYLGKSHPQPDPVETVILNLRATSLLMTLLRHGLHTAVPSDALQADETYVSLAEKYILENFQSIESIQQVSKNTGIGYDHLRHIFKALRGKSLIRYLNEIRISQAKSHLVYSFLSVKQIAAVCGYNDEYYFSAVFRKLEGLSPLQFRQLGVQRGAVARRRPM